MVFSVSVILPTYNEKDNVKKVIDRVSQSLGDMIYEFIIVDDDSPDMTWKVAQNLNNPKVKVIRRTTEKGLASALWRGIQEAKGNVIVWMDCDLGLPPENLPKMVDKLKEYDVVIGSRYVKGGGDPRSPLRAFLSLLLNRFAMFLLGSQVTDYTSGFPAVKSEVFKKVKFTPEGFGEYFIEFAYNCQKNKFNILELPCVYQPRIHGVSKSDGNLLTMLRLGKDYIIKIIRLRFNI